MRKTLALILILAAASLAQKKSDEAVRPGAAPDKPDARLVEENEHFRVKRIDLAGESKVSVVQRGSDVIVVALGDGLSLSSANGPTPEKLADGDVRFVPRSLNPIIFHSGDETSQAIVVDLRHHWDAEIRPCTEPKTCAHPIRAGGFEIGQTTALFTNGFVTAYRHRMDRGGTLATSYYSSKGKDHLLLIAAADLQANFDGTEQELKRGQVFASDAAEVDIDAGPHAVRWVVIRVEVPTVQK